MAPLHYIHLAHTLSKASHNKCIDTQQEPELDVIKEKTHTVEVADTTEYLLYLIKVKPKGGIFCSNKAFDLQHIGSCGIQVKWVKHSFQPVWSLATKSEHNLPAKYKYSRWAIYCAVWSQSGFCCFICLSLKGFFVFFLLISILATGLTWVHLCFFPQFCTACTCLCNFLWFRLTNEVVCLYNAVWQSSSALQTVLPSPPYNLHLP